MAADRDTWVAGVDGCPGGWLLVLRGLRTGTLSHCLQPVFGEILALALRPVVVAVDMPIGLLDAAEKGGRACDRAARVLLGERGCCVFSPPVRPALRCVTYASACQTNSSSSKAAISLSQQAFGLFQKLREVHAQIKPKTQDQVFEVHPELAFYELNQQSAMQERKKSSAGFAARRSLLMQAGFAETIDEMLTTYQRQKVARDDILDACVCCWTAERIWRKKALRIPEDPPKDSRELRMEIWR